jgi:carbon-monoxide dehydrogenase small subunit
VTEPLTAVGISVNVNGIDRSVAVEPRVTLAELLRERFGLTGTHLGCEHGVCGSCTVLIDGASARSCLTLAAQTDGRAVTTIEGLGWGALQRGCWESHSFQCGFCTPGFLAVATELLAANPQPTEAEVREALSGNLCRCTGYDSIVAGVLRAAELRAAELRAAGSEQP